MRKVKLKNILSYTDELVSLYDEKEYITIKVKRRFGGLEAREIFKGKDIKTKKQYKLVPHSFIISRVQCWHQAYAIVPDKLEDNMIASINYDQFKILPGVDVRYFWWIANSKEFTQLVRSCASGIVKEKMVFNRAAFLEKEILLPSLYEQVEIAQKIDCIANKIWECQCLFEETELNLNKLRSAILKEAVQGKLIRQDASDEPARELLNRIKAEKQKLIKEGSLKKEKELPPIPDVEIPFDLPKNWIWCRLGDIVIKSEAGKSLVCDKRPAEKDEWGIIKVSAMSWGEFNEQENKVLPRGTKPFIEYKINEGDYLISRANTEELIGKSVIVRKLKSNLLLSDKSIRIIFSGLVDKEFINIYNNSLIARAYYREVASGTSDSMKNITREQMYFLPFPLPPFYEQQRIVAKAQQLQQQLNTLETQVQQSRQYANQLLQSVLKEAFEVNKKEYATNEQLTMAAEG